MFNLFMIICGVLIVCCLVVLSWPAHLLLLLIIPFVMIWSMLTFYTNSGK